MGQTLTEYGREPPGKCYKLKIKDLGIVVSEKNIFEDCILKRFYLSRDLLMILTGTILTI